MHHRTSLLNPPFHIGIPTSRCPFSMTVSSTSAPGRPQRSLLAKRLTTQKGIHYFTFQVDPAGRSATGDKGGISRWLGKSTTKLQTSAEVGRHRGRAPYRR